MVLTKIIHTPNKYKIIIALCWLISIYLFFNSPENLNKTYMSFSLLNLLISTLFFFFYLNHIFKKLIFTSLTFLFVTSMIITHFQVGTSHVFGYEIINEWFYNFVWGNYKTGNLALSIASLGLTSFYLGHVFKTKIKIRKIKDINYARKYEPLIEIVTFFTIVFYILFFITSGSYKYGNYYAGDQLEVSNYFLGFFRMLIKTALILKMYLLYPMINKISNIREYISFIGVPLSIIVLWHVLFSIFVGDRGPVIVFGILYFGLYFTRFIKKRYNLIILLFFFIISISFSILGDSRTRIGNESFLSKITNSDYESRYSTYFSQENMPGLSTLELALSIRSLNHSVANVPSNFDYKYGEYQLKQVLASVPFLVGFLDNYIIKGKKSEASSADFITFLIQGENPKYGDATTPVADLYLDFGPIGVLFGFFIFGRWVKRTAIIINFLEHTGLFNWIFIMIFWSGAIYLGRATFLYYFQTAIQIYFSILIMNSLLMLRYK